MMEEEKPSIVQLVLIYQNNKDDKVLDQIVVKLMPVAKRLAKKLVRDKDQFDDLVQVASIGMLKAVNNYDHSRKTNFYGYLIPVMIGEIKHYYREQNWVIKAPRRQKELSVKIYNVSPELAQKLGKTPNVADIARELGVTEEEIIEAMNYQNTYNLTSFEKTIYATQDSKRIKLGQVIGEVDYNIGKIDDQSELEDILSKLNTEDRKLLILRFVDRLTQQEIADILGISQMQVSRMIKTLLLKLKYIKENLTL